MSTNTPITVTPEDNEAFRREFKLDKPVSADAIASSDHRRAVQIEDCNDESNRLQRKLKAYSKQNYFAKSSRGCGDYYCIWCDGGRGRGNYRGYHVFTSYKLARSFDIDQGRDGRIADLVTISF